MPKVKNDVVSKPKAKPLSEDAKAKIDGLKKKLKEIEKRLNDSLNMYR